MIQDNSEDYASSPPMGGSFRHARPPTLGHRGIHTSLFSASLSSPTRRAIPRNVFRYGDDRGREGDEPHSVRLRDRVCRCRAPADYPPYTADPPGSGTVTPGRRSGDPMGPRESNGPSVSQGGAGGGFSASWICVGSDDRTASNDHSGMTFTS